MNEPVFSDTSSCWSPVTFAVCIFVSLLTRSLGTASKHYNLFCSSSYCTSHPLISTSVRERAKMWQLISHPSSLLDWTSAMCLCILRWLHSPPDSVREPAVISHLRRRQTPDSRDTSQRCVFYGPTSRSCSWKHSAVWFTTVTHGLHQLCGKKKSACVHVLPTLDDITEINSGGSGHPTITSPFHLMSVLVTMVMAYPKVADQIIIFSLGSVVQTTIQPTPLRSQTSLIKHLAADLVSPGSRSPPTKSQLLSELCVFTAVLAVLLIIEIFGNKQHLLSFQLLIWTYYFLLLLPGDMKRVIIIH